MKNIYIKRHASNANKWIYQGYFNAWSFHGFNPIYYDSLTDITENDFYLMAADWDIVSRESLDVLKRAKKAFLFVQPTKYELPWSNHPNFMCFLPPEVIKEIDGLNNVHKWTFTDHELTDYYFAWTNVHKYPLAFDNISYGTPERNVKLAYDICYVGGRAHNGFDEKYKIMMKYFAAFKDSGLKCGFFIEKNLKHEQERDVIFNSKICLNIHDANQLKTNIDTNERTFKTLGLNGMVVCNNNGQFSRLFPHISTATTPEALVLIAKELCDKDLTEQKIANRANILKNHTYSTRVEEMKKYV